MPLIGIIAKKRDFQVIKKALRESDIEIIEITKELQRRNKEKSKQKSYALKNKNIYKMQIAKKKNSKINIINNSNIEPKSTRIEKSININETDVFLKKEKTKIYGCFRNV